MLQRRQSEEVVIDVGYDGSQRFETISPAPAARQEKYNADFTAKNAYGVELSYRAICEISPKGELSIGIAEK